MESPTGEFVCKTPQDTFDLGKTLGKTLRGGEMVLLAGGLGAGKTLFTKGASKRRADLRENTM